MILITEVTAQPTRKKQYEGMLWRTDSAMLLNADIWFFQENKILLFLPQIKEDALIVV